MLPLFRKFDCINIEGSVSCSLTLHSFCELMPFGCLLLNKDKCVTYGRRVCVCGSDRETARGWSIVSLSLASMSLLGLCDTARSYCSYCFCLCCACAKPIEECSDAAALLALSRFCGELNPWFPFEPTTTPSVPTLEFRLGISSALEQCVPHLSKFFTGISQFLQAFN